MLKICCKIPQKIAVGVSGGVDSMAVLNFLQNGDKEITVLHYNHGSRYADNAEQFVRDYCQRNNLNIKVGKFPSTIKPGENSWREERYKWFESTGEKTIITCHHLNDAVEWWLFTSFRGNPKLIPRQRDVFIRPFLITIKSKLKDWCLRKNIPWIEDPSNADTDYSRNQIRNVILPEIKKVNPGIEKTILKKYLSQEDLV